MPVRREVAITAAAIAAAGVFVGGVTAVSNASTPSLAKTGYSANGPTAPGADEGGGVGGHSHTAVTGTELDKVKAAVKAKDSAVTVQNVRKDPDGSYDVMGTKNGSPVRLEVSKDLKTIETRTGGPDGRMDGMGEQAPSTSSSSDTSTTSATSTV